MPEKTILPVHVGFILDGNRRWAREQGLPTLEGHRIGYANLKELGKYAINRGIRYVSAYIFSTENWNRTKEEVKYLMNLAYNVVTKDVKELHKANIRVLWLGRRERLSSKLLKAIEKAEVLTKGNTRGTLSLCFNYGGRQEIADAANNLAQAGQPITVETLSKALYKPEIPDVDLIIRTSGEQRLSNFMLWRAAYAELYFSPKHWPAFSSTFDDFEKALAEFARRHRRFGK